MDLSGLVCDWSARMRDVSDFGADLKRRSLESVATQDPRGQGLRVLRRPWLSDFLQRQIHLLGRIHDRVEK